MVNRLNQAGIVPKTHVLDTNVSANTKTITRDKYHMTIELVSQAATDKMQRKWQ